MRLAGKVAIISGAASGMGAATARMFAREGAKVVIADVLEQEGRQVADAIGASARFEPLDVTKEESWAAVVAPPLDISASSTCWSTMPASPAALNRIFTAPKRGTGSWRSTQPAWFSALNTRFRP